MELFEWPDYMTSRMIYKNSALPMNHRMIGIKETIKIFRSITSDHH